ncbi:PDZ domain-containing protein [Caerostris darwini]|uniref:PDZ domain-containing protein n=1 Tax=Caerostris darwini TaxID=1538125 RepID=A0AAV4VHH3_9ARAC|nr:PDZ domain-containing protein [Caerostris darwini]
MHYLRRGLSVLTASNLCSYERKQKTRIKFYDCECEALITVVVNPGSKAYHQGLLEGDLLKMVNGFITDGLSQMDVQNIIKETGTHLTLEVERNPVVQNDVEKTYTARTTITFNGSPNYGR